MTDTDGTSLMVALLRRAIQRPRWAMAPLVTLALIGLAIGLVRSAGYVAQSSVRPDSPSIQMGALSGLASQIGLNLAAGGESEPLDYYVRLFKSRDLLRALATTTYSINEESDPTKAPRFRSGDVVELLDIRAASREEGIYEAIRRLDAMVAVRPEASSGIITLRTSANSADLATHLNKRAIELMTAVDLDHRQRRARAEREFLAGRAQVARTVLDSAESVLLHFLERNRDQRNSPRLQFDQDRLERAVALRQQVYTAELQALEHAMVEEVRNTTIISVIDGPASWVLPNGGLVLMTGIGIILGFLCSLWVIAAMPRIERIGLDLRDTYWLVRRRQHPAAVPDAPPNQRSTGPG